MSYETTLEVKLTLIYNYEPGEPRTYNEPGCEADVDVYGAEIDSVELNDYQFKRFWHDLDQSTKDQFIEEIHQHETEKAADAVEYRDEARREALAEGSLFHFGANLARLHSLSIRRHA